LNEIIGFDGHFCTFRAEHGGLNLHGLAATEGAKGVRMRDGMIENGTASSGRRREPLPQYGAAWRTQVLFNPMCRELSSYEGQKQVTTTHKN
jgi:hypothetical protein